MLGNAPGISFHPAERSPIARWASASKNEHLWEEKVALMDVEQHRPRSSTEDLALPVIIKA